MDNAISNLGNQTIQRHLSGYQHVQGSADPYAAAATAVASTTKSAGTFAKVLALVAIANLGLGIYNSFYKKS